MGLDMYLYLRKDKYRGYSKQDTIKYPQTMKFFEESIEKRNFKSMEIRTDYQIGYWRKFNALHNWFVQHCADGVDNCRDIYVSKEQLCGLRELCKSILEDHDLAKSCLPTKEGFFFGSLDYDEWYFKELEYTKDLLDKLIEFLNKYNTHSLFDDWRVVYHASW